MDEEKWQQVIMSYATPFYYEHDFASHQAFRPEFSGRKGSIGSQPRPRRFRLETGNRKNWFLRAQGRLHANQSGLEEVRGLPV